MEKIWLKSYPQLVKATIPDDTGTISNLLESVFNRFRDRPAFHNMGTTLTYKQLDEASANFASYLQHELKLPQGSKIALMMPNILQYPIALCGVLRAGMIVVNVNPLYTQRELRHQLIDSDTKAILIFKNACHILENVLADTAVEHVITTGLGDMLKFPKNLIVNTVVKYVKKMVPDYNIAKEVSFQQALALGAKKPMNRVNISPKDIAFLQYTGGTTGVSKGAVLSHRNITANIAQAREWLGSDILSEDGQIIVTPLPLYHIFSLTANFFTYSSIGGLNVLITNPRDLPNFVKELAKWKFNALTGVNTLFNGLINNEEFKKLDFSHMKLTLGGGMAVQKPVAEKWKKITGHPLIEAYGLSETSPAACINPMSLKEFNGCIGLPISSTEVAILSDEGKQLPIGEVGEISIRGPQVMQGYWKRPDETEKVMTQDGFFKTGDLGFMDKDGFIKLVDRKKDMILVSGFNVYPNEVEEVLASHPKVLEAAVVGVPCEKSGEAIKAFIVKKDDSLTVEELKAFCKDNLTGYKNPRHFEFRKDLPKTNVGKILRRELKTES